MDQKQSVKKLKVEFVNGAFSPSRATCLAHYFIGLTIIPAIIIYGSLSDIIIFVVMSYAYVMVANNIGMHKLISHRSFSPSKPMYYFITTFAHLTGAGSGIICSVLHSQHHAYSDTIKDLRSPRHYSIWRTLVGPAFLTFNAMLLRRMSRDPWLLFCHKYYWLMNFVYAGLLYMISPNLAVVAWLAPGAASILIVRFFLDRICHNTSFGYRNYDLDDDSKNNHISAFMTGGEYHNNHHAHPLRANTAEKPGEIDISYQLLKLLRQVP